MFRVIVADPPWQLSNKGTRASAEDHYPTMSLEEIIALGPEVQSLALPDSILFLWVVGSMLEEALLVMRSWGFVPKQTFAWIKTEIGMGNYFRQCHELAIVGTRGKPAALVRNRSLRSFIIHPRGEHSQKPELAQDAIEKLIEGPYLELFARRKREGWTVMGNEVEDV